MARSRRNQDSDISRIVGILLLEVLGALALLQLAGIARQERAELNRPASPTLNVATEQVAADPVQHEVYPYPEPVKFETEKTLPKILAGRYNGRW